MEYKGITTDVLFLMADNRFRDSKAFYDQHKEALKQGMTIPMRQIAGIVGQDLVKLDPLMVVEPTKMVSRIRRDTRFTKDKSLYRDNMWIMFTRDKYSWRSYPCFWFEVTQTSYSMGVGVYSNDAGFLECYRKHLRENTAEFKKAVKKCESVGAQVTGNSYKRKTFEGCPKGLEDFYLHKELGFIIHSTSFDDLKDDTIIEIIRKNFKAFSPMYKFLLNISDEYYSEAE